jgi:hypothetical protein
VAPPPALLFRATAWVDHLGRAHFTGASIDSIPTVLPPLTIYHIRNGTIPESHFFNYLAAFLGGFPNFIHTRHIFLCGTKVAFLCGKSPVESGKPHLQNAAFPAFIVTALSPCIFALSPVLPVEL